MIQVEHLCKNYGSKTAIQNLNFTIKKGDITGFLGPNGAGKSTTLNLLTGTLAPTSGKITINGYNFLEFPQQAKSCLGYLPETPPLYPEMKVLEYLRFVCRLKKVQAPIDSYLNSICLKTKIDSVTDRVIKNLSKGYKQRVGLAQALIGDPEILILDEPTSGMDPKQIIDVRNLLNSLKEKHTIIFSSHVLSEIESVCTRILIIRNGKIVADSTAKDLSFDFNQRSRLFIRFDGPVDTVVRKLSSVPDVQKIFKIGSFEKNSFDIEIQTRSGKDIRRLVFKYMSEMKIPILNMYFRELSLEDIFMKVTN